MGGSNNKHARYSRENDKLVVYMQGYMSRHFEEQKQTSRKLICQVTSLQQAVNELSSSLNQLDLSVQSIGHLADNLDHKLNDVSHV